MQNDEQAIRDLVARWNEATIAGDVETVLGMVAEDAIFQVAGRAPFSKEAFAQGFRAGLEQVRIDVRSEIEELQVAGDFAYLPKPHLCHLDAPRRWRADEANRLHAYDSAQTGGWQVAADT